MERDERAAIIPGVILVCLGLALLAAQFVPGIGGETVVFGLGLAFLAIYFYMREFGFLVPAGVLTGLGLGLIAKRTIGGGAAVLGLGLGFVAIWVLDRLYTRASNFWPLIPGGILLVVGLGTTVPSLGAVVGRLWPLGLVILGVVFVVLALRGRGAPR